MRRRSSNEHNEPRKTRNDTEVIGKLHHIPCFSVHSVAKNELSYLCVLCVLCEKMPSAFCPQPPNTGFAPSSPGTPRSERTKKLTQRRGGTEEKKTRIIPHRGETPRLPSSYCPTLASFASFARECVCVFPLSSLPPANFASADFFSSSFTSYSSLHAARSRRGVLGASVVWLSTKLRVGESELRRKRNSTQRRRGAEGEEVGMMKDECGMHPRPTKVSHQARQGGSEEIPRLRSG